MRVCGRVNGQDQSACIGVRTHELPARRRPLEDRVCLISEQVSLSLLSLQSSRAIGAGHAVKQNRKLKSLGGFLLGLGLGASFDAPSPPKRLPALPPPPAAKRSFPSSSSSSKRPAEKPVKFERQCANAPRSRSFFMKHGKVRRPFVHTFLHCWS